MKKIFVIGVVLLAGLSSCKKHYTCTCDEYIDGAATNNNGKTIGWNASKNEGNAIRCSTYESTHSVNGSNVSYTCVLTEG